MSKQDGGPAFPIAGRASQTQSDYYNGGYHIQMSGGMFLRDYFAAVALPAVIAAYDAANKPCIGTDHILHNCPIIAYKMADAMLAERSKE